jgi:hypothetical protein
MDDACQASKNWEDKSRQYGKVNKYLYSGVQPEAEVIVEVDRQSGRQLQGQRDRVSRPSPINTAWQVGQQKRRNNMSLVRKSWERWGFKQGTENWSRIIKFGFLNTEGLRSEVGKKDFLCTLDTGTQHNGNSEQRGVDLRNWEIQGLLKREN